ncbi:Alpha/Beta hydrolase protein [Dendryphion nanum]|uniref:Alpha/Beta hydrolase protein n=1 Tax=Dendryphion nanum TaxID=256645 RepID=A0A9P9I9P4_9PLEO|nr:Alpha/Beta hydrolase protein [Dendryphion nanum]
MKFIVHWLIFATFCGANGNPSDCGGVKAVSPRCSSNETPYRRDFFYVGGRYIQTAFGNVTVNQIYVEKLSPLGGNSKANPLVFFHGGATSAVSWLNTPDNRKGWATYFVEKGYHVYLVDAYSGARSAANDFEQYTFLSGQPAELIQMGFTAPSDKHTQFPGSGIDNGDPAFDAFKKAMIPWTTNFVSQELAMRASGCELLRLLGTPAFLISHSLGSFYPILLSNDCPQLIKGSVNLEAATTPFWRYNVGSLGGVSQSPYGLVFSPLSYEPPISNASDLIVQSIGNDTLERRNCYQQVEPARKLRNVSSVPYLGLTSEGSTHITFGHCIINYLKQVGGKPEYVKLAEIGIKGNGHFMHLELNNLKIAKLVEDWIIKQDKKS